MDIKTMTDSELQDDFLVLDEMIFGENGCYGSRDLAIYNIEERELHRRGFEIEKRVITSFIKK